MIRSNDPVPPRGTSRPLGRRGWSAAGWVGVLLLVGLAAPRALPRLHASTGVSNDPDGDGLVTSQEVVLGTRPNRADTDGDGFTDGEEIARHSEPLSSGSVPLPSALDLGMTARGEDGEVRVVAAVYAQDGVVGDKIVEFGVYAHGRMLFMPPSYVGAVATSTVVDASHGAGKILVLDLPITPEIVHRAGTLSVFATVQDGQGGVVDAADAITLVSSGGVIFERVERGGVRPFMAMQGGSYGVGSVYRPIPPGGDGDIPAAWSPGQICSQTTQIVGTSGAVVTHEVVAADCVDGWDAYCREDCQATVGSTFQTIDPSVFVGN